MRRCLVVLVSLLAAPATAAADSRFTNCAPAFDVARISCEEGAPVAAAVVDGDPLTALAAAGWTPISARKRAPTAEVMAARDRAIIRIRVPGEAPDAMAVVAGRELLLSSRRLVGGRPVPDDAAVCTTAFPVVIRDITRALSAGHCAANERTGRIERKYTAVRRPPQPGVVLGTVRNSLFVRTTLDALVLRVPSGEGRGAAPLVWRGAFRPPWAVIGTARPLPGRRVCFVGATSGVDRCGRIGGRGAAEAARELLRFDRARVVCSTARAREGDSGGPVYTRASSGGTVRALGISTLVIGRQDRLCFTPIAPVLRALRAELIASP